MRTITGLVLMGMVLGSVDGVQAEVLSRLALKGETASAFFNEETPITCADGSEGAQIRSVSLTGSDFVTKQRKFPTQATNTVLVFFSTFNTCTQEGMVLDGRLDNAFVQDRFTSATFAGTVPLVDGEGNVLATAVLDVTLTGVGAIRRDNAHDKFEVDLGDGTLVQITHTKGADRDVTASGSITVNGSELIDLFLVGVIGETKSSTLQVLR